MFRKIRRHLSEKPEPRAPPKPRPGYRMQRSISNVTQPVSFIGYYPVIETPILSRNPQNPVQLLGYYSHNSNELLPSNVHLPSRIPERPEIESSSESSESDQGLERRSTFPQRLQSIQNSLRGVRSPSLIPQPQQLLGPPPELPQQRANNFKQLLTRFQSADRVPQTRLPRRYTLDASQSPMPLQRYDSSPHRDRENSSERSNGHRSRESAFSPIHRRPTDPIHRRAPKDGDEREAALIYTQETILNAIPAQAFGRDPSPLSHTGSTPPPEAPKPPPLTVTIPTPKARRAPRTRWIKETDIDDPASLPVSPTCALTPDPTPPSETPPTPPRSAPIYGDEVKFRNGLISRRLGSEQDSLDSSKSITPNYIRRSRSRNERSPAPSPMRSSQNGSRSSICMIHPIQMEHLHQNGNQQKGRGTPDATTRNKDTEAVYHQMTLSNVNALAYISDHLADNVRLRNETIPKEKYDQLNFKDFILRSSSPQLIKGSCLFYDAILPLDGKQEDLDVTLMIAPSSQYGPLLRRGSDCGVPSLMEMEDHDGSISRFLKEGGRQAQLGRNPRVVVMPRQSLFSFHQLTAHNLHTTLSIENHESHVAFILIQLLSALKNVQSDDVEHLSNNFKEFLLAYRNTSFHGTVREINEHPRLIFLPETLGNDLDEGDNEYVGLCKYALRSLCTLLHYKMDGRAPHILNRSRFSKALLACARELETDRSSSLTRAKNILEIAFFASQERFETEYTAKLWLDAQRADCVANMVRRLVDHPDSWPLRDRFQVDFLLSIAPRGLQLAFISLSNTHF
ncbi:unnamed protein product, partial [Mesorhabditis belari]|uniref:Uncharacterized protein n=1 Tax=Mesorhabditis belari TaxID=2138241 RepID=A0AAF3J433_9BILA